jgi:hypothetical protein
LALPSHLGQLTAAVARLRGCLGSLPPLLRDVLELRTGVGAHAALSRGQVAGRLHVSMRRIAGLETRAATALLRLGRSGGCAGHGLAAADSIDGVAMPADFATIGPGPVPASALTGQGAQAPTRTARRHHGSPTAPSASGGGSVGGPAVAGPGTVVPRPGNGVPMVEIAAAVVLLLALADFLVLPGLRRWRHRGTP